jgi:hypothetical protein
VTATRPPHTKPHFEFKELTNKAKEDHEIVTYFQNRFHLSEESSDHDISNSSDNTQTLNSLVANCYESEENDNDNTTTPLDQVAASLIRLKLSIERLVKRNLFPYNVQPLLRRLKEFEECYEQQLLHRTEHDVSTQRNSCEEN